MTTFDPTTNRIPYGLLTKDEKNTLGLWPHDLECYIYGEWADVRNAWNPNSVYRGKPAPVITSTWRNVYSDDLIGSVRTNSSRLAADRGSDSSRIAVLRIDTCNGVSTAHLEGV